MKVGRSIISGTLFGVIVSASIVAAHLLPILTAEIDPNTGKAQCPGGKDWDLPGSSCHYGMIVDSYIPAVPEKTMQEGIRRGDIVRSRVPRKVKRGH
jgi:hypothetical protein